MLRKLFVLFLILISTNLLSADDTDRGFCGYVCRTTGVLEGFAADASVSPVDSSDPGADKITELQRLIKDALDFNGRDPVRCCASCDKAAALCRDLNFKLTECALSAFGARIRAFEMSAYPEAEKGFFRAVWIMTEEGDKAALASLYEDYAKMSLAVGRRSGASAYYTRAASYRGESVKAGADYMAAGSALANLEGFNIINENALPALRRNVGKNKTILAEALVTASELAAAIDKPKAALDIAKEARNLTLPEGLVACRVYEQLGNAYALSGNATADEAHRKRKVLSDKIVEKAATSSDGAYVCEAAEAALRYGYGEAESLLRRAVEMCEKSGDAEKMCDFSTELSKLLAEGGKTEEAGKIVMKAVFFASEKGNKSAASRCARGFLPAVEHAENADAAMNMLAEMITVFEKNGDAKGLGELCYSGAKIRTAAGKHEEAAKGFAEARQIFTETVGDLWAAGRVAADESRCLAKLGKPTEASDLLFETLKSLAGESLNDITYGTDHEDILFDIYKLCAEYSAAADMTDRADLLMRGAARRGFAVRILRDLAASEDTKVSEWASKSEYLNSPGTEIARTDTSVPVVIAEGWTSFVKYCLLARSGSVYTGYKSLPIDPEQLYRLRSRIPEDTAFVEYLFSGSTVFVIVCTSENAVYAELPGKAEEIAEQVRVFEKLNASKEENIKSGIPVPPVTDFKSAAFAETKEVLSRLYYLLLEPIKPYISGVTNLCFAPGGCVEGLPMHALISREEPTVRFVINDHAVSYLPPSASDLLLVWTKRTLDLRDCRVSVFADPKNTLPGAVEEAKEIKKAVPQANIYSGADATEKNFLRELPLCGILHIAAHHSGDVNPVGFTLELAEGTVEFDDLKRSGNTPLELVVLSACETAGKSAMAESFILNGARSVIGGLWKISDDSASYLCGAFYRALASGAGKAEALRLAQIELAESGTFTDPYYWAPMALYGSPR
ncbi:MAG: CHAT domain-containing protein [Abditibacteriota bacterium]|nr:CHAT domain-containing protein [Abditibacteriota bacterium]